MKRAIHLLLLFLLVRAGTLSAQDTLGLGAGGQIFNLQDSAFYNDAASFYVWIKNYSVNTYQGIVNLTTSVDTGAGPVFVQNDSATVSILPNDSLPVVINETFTPQNYRVGGNIVVIWPSATNAYFLELESQPDTVYIYGFSNVGEFLTGIQQIYPVPFRDQINFTLIKGKAHPERFRLFSVDGRCVLEKEFSLQIFPDQDLKSGTYILELIYPSGQKEHRLISKS